VILSPLCPEQTQPILQEIILHFEKFEKIFESACAGTGSAARTETPVSIVIVFIQSIVSFPDAFPDLVDFVIGFAMKFGSFLLIHSPSILSRNSMKGTFATFLIQMQSIPLIPANGDGGGEEREKSVGEYLLHQFYEEDVSAEAVDHVRAELLKEFEGNQRVKSLFVPMLSKILLLSSRSFDSSAQARVMQVLGQLLDLSSEDNAVIQQSYNLDSLEPNSQSPLESFQYFSQIVLPEKSIGPDMTTSDWNRCFTNPPQSVNEVSGRHPPQSANEGESFVLTPTAWRNIENVKSAATRKIPQLLQGAAGVGKTATIIEAAKQSGNSKTPIRVNLSPQTQVEDLIGKLMLIPDQQDHFGFVPHPFTIAFRDGHWLLLDELNLAPDNVLQALESALDSGILLLPEVAIGQFPSRKIEMHPNFRVFATQNPHSGFFKNAREKLSCSFLDRFSPFNFEELPESEWTPIIESKLDQRGICDKELKKKISTKIVRDHMGLCKLLRAPDFSEKASYSYISLRELLRIVDHLSVHYHCQPHLFKTSNSLDSLIGYELWNVYGSRFRSIGRKAVIEFLQENNYNYSIQPQNWDITPHMIRIDDIRRDYIASPPPAPVDDTFPSIFVEIDKKAMGLLYSKEFILKHGVYLNGRSWVSQWFKLKQQSQTTEQFLQDGCALYLSKFVHQEAQQSMCAIFLKDDQDLKVSVPDLPEKSYTVTKYSLAIWKQLIVSALTKQPEPDSFLLVGQDGCGKSNCLRAFAVLVGRSLEELCVMPETEPSAFIGQFLPNENISANHEPRIIWADGAVTDAFKNGSWLLLDNFSQAEPSVLERLNPVLEQPHCSKLVALFLNA
jgi:MoxR-like ATPase